MKRIVIAAMAGMVLLIGIYGYINGTNRQLEYSIISHESGYAYKIDVQDSNFYRLCSPEKIYNICKLEIQILENGKPFVKFTNNPETVRNQGGGIYTFLPSAILFSATDNSDPRKNKKSYELHYVEHLRLRYLLVIAVLCLGVIFWISNGVRLTDDKSSEIPFWFWFAFSIILIIAVAFRLWWTSLLGCPYWKADTGSYIYPALESPWFPLSELRTIGLPYFFSLALAIWHHPLALLVAQHCLWLISSVLLCWSLVKRFRLLTIALILLCYLSFVQKNIHFEYLLYSEQMARCFYVIFFALWFLWWDKLSIGRCVILGIIFVTNFLVKPSAFPLIGVFILVELLRRKDVLAAKLRYMLPRACAFGAVSAIILLAVCFGFWLRYGQFNITSSTGGRDLYSHVSHLTYLDGGCYPEIKKELRLIIPIYRNKYTNKWDFRPNWVIYNKPYEDILRDIGYISPLTVVREFVRKYPGHGSRDQQINKVWETLALEAIYHSPVDYLHHVAISLARLLGKGVTGFYDPKTLTFDQRNYELLEYSKQRFKEAWLDSARQPPQSLGNMTGSNWQPTSSQVRTLSVLTLFAEGVSKAVDIVFGGYKLWILWALCIPFLIWSAREAIYRSLLLAIFALGSFCVLYILFLALINSAEPPRFLLNIQDLAILGCMMSLYISFKTIWEAVIPNKKIIDEIHVCRH